MNLLYCPTGLAWLLYSILVVRRKHKTLGMDFCGLSVVDEETTTGGRGGGGGTSRSSTRLWKCMALSAILSILIDITLREDNHSETNDDQIVATTQQQRRHRQQQQHDVNTLRGPARHQFYQDQRRAMMQRANQMNQPVVDVVATLTERQEQPSVSSSSSLPGNTTSWTSRRQELLRRTKKLVQSTLLELASSTVAEEGPHRIATPMTNSSGTLSKWIMRLVMVHFLLRGNFPMWKLWGIQLKKDRHAVLANRPNWHRFVALLLLQQTVTAGVKNVVQWLTTWWVQRRRPSQLQSTTPRIATSSTHPMSKGDNEHNPQRKPNSTLLSSSSSSTTTTTMIQMSCGICKLPRSHPALSIHCGHVFCWTCLCQWTSTVRPHCPLCRVSCRPQDILPLYGYQPE